MILKSKICGVSDSKVLNFIVNHDYPQQFVGFIVNYPKLFFFSGTDGRQDTVMAEMYQKWPKMDQNQRTACQWCASDVFIVLAHHWQACAAFRRLTPRPANDAQVVGTMSQAHHWQAFRWSWMRKRRPANDAQVTIPMCFPHPKQENSWHAASSQ